MIKLNLECGYDVRNGYININSKPIELDKIPVPSEAKFYTCYYGNLDPIIGDGEVDELVFSEKLNALAYTEVFEVLKHWIKKIKQTGKIFVNFYDIRLIARDLHLHDLALKDAHNRILGENNKFKMLFDLELLRASSHDLGLDIENVSFDDSVISVELVKSKFANL